jgi:hypothetical protein
MYLVQSDASTTYYGLSYYVSWTERCLFTDFSIGCSIYLCSCIINGSNIVQWIINLTLHQPVIYNLLNISAPMTTSLLTVS